MPNISLETISLNEATTESKNFPPKKSIDSHETPAFLFNKISEEYLNIFTKPFKTNASTPKH